jgi:hypothetical protein
VRASPPCRSRTGSCAACSSAGCSPVVRARGWLRLRLRLRLRPRVRVRARVRLRLRLRLRLRVKD